MGDVNKKAQPKTIPGYMNFIIGGASGYDTLDHLFKSQTTLNDTVRREAASPVKLACAPR